MNFTSGDRGVLTDDEADANRKFGSRGGGGLGFIQSVSPEVAEPQLEEEDFDVVVGSTPRRKFVNTVRGSGFPEISLDDLAIELFVMQKELRHDVEEIRTELEQEKRKTKSTIPAIHGSLRSNSSDVLQAVSSIRKNNSTKLEQRNNDKGRVSKRLSEEAEKYIEDFILNLEDTDISSLDGERSDTNSSLGGIMKSENSNVPCMGTSPLPAFMDGVVLPWLQWETSNDATPIGCKTEPPVTPKTFSWGASQEATDAQDWSSQSASSRGSWSSGIINSLPINIMEDAFNKVGESGTCQRDHSGVGQNLHTSTWNSIFNSKTMKTFSWKHSSNNGELVLEVYCL